jgi:hypothetical protein
VKIHLFLVAKEKTIENDLTFDSDMVWVTPRGIIFGPRLTLKKYWYFQRLTLHRKYSPRPKTVYFL